MNTNQKTMTLARARVIIYQFSGCRIRKTRAGYVMSRDVSKGVYTLADLLALATRIEQRNQRYK